MSRKSYHVVRNKNYWAVKSNGSTLSGHQTQQEAIESGKLIAKLTHGELAVHGRNGKIREKNSYFHPDSFPPQG